MSNVKEKLTGNELKQRTQSVFWYLNLLGKVKSQTVVCHFPVSSFLFQKEKMLLSAYCVLISIWNSSKRKWSLNHFCIKDFPRYKNRCYFLIISALYAVLLTNHCSDSRKHVYIQLAWFKIGLVSSIIINLLIFSGDSDDKQLLHACGLWNCFPEDEKLKI